MHDDSLSTFIDRWTKSGGAERANYQLFLAELCDGLAVDRPDPSVEDDAQNAYVFERCVRFDNRDGTHSTKRIDLYKRGSFVCETKQGVQAKENGLDLSAKETERRKSRKKGHGTRGTPAWNDAMLRAVGQAEQYARALPAEEGRPPFLVVIDVGHSIELYAEFSQTGGSYVAFPDHRSHRIKLAQLTDAEIRERLRLVWTDPLALDPARRTAKVTREIAAKLAELAKSLEASGEHRPEDVAHFLMRCLFTMFAEDIGLLPKKTSVISFRRAHANARSRKINSPFLSSLYLGDKRDSRITVGSDRTCKPIDGEGTRNRRNTSAFRLRLPSRDETGAPSGRTV